MKVKCISAILVVLTGAMLFACVLWSRATMDPVPETCDIVLRMAVPNAKEHPNTLTAMYFSNLVMEKSEGRICIELYPESQLGTQEASLEQLRFGGIDFAIVESHILLNYIHGDDIKEEIVSSDENVSGLSDEDLNKYGIESLARFKADYRCISNASRELQEGSDVDELTLRVSGKYIMENLLTSQGFRVVFQESMDIREAIRNSYIDGAEMAFLDYIYDDYGSIMPYITLIDGIDICGVLLSSNSSMGAMTVENQSIIRECAAEAALFQTEAQSQCHKEAIDYLEWCGIIEHPTDIQMLYHKKGLHDQQTNDEIEVS